MTAASTVQPLPCRHQRLAARQVLHRHRHVEPYVAVVLHGSYQEAGDQGRRRLRPGDAVLHAGFSAHGNRVDEGGARLLNLPMTAPADGFARVDDLDRLARLAERDPQAAADAVVGQLRPLPATLSDWPDLLARDLLLQPGLSLSAWAGQQGLAVETLSRGFFRVFGLTPRRLGFELRTRRALTALTRGREPLASVALEAGFADQAHMGHAVLALTGRTPREWRLTSSRDKTEDGRAGTVRR